MAMSTVMKSEELPADKPASTGVSPAPSSEQEGYTIQYDKVSIREFLRFAGKICNTNFLFNEEDVDFTVSILSDAPITAENVMAMLLQTLRMHNLELLEQDNNLVIHKSPDVKQIATLVTENGQASKAPVVTRIFRIRYTKPDAIASLIRPMISSASILEVSVETRQLILTDVTANVNKVAALLEILDSPHNPLEMKTYEPKHNTPDALIAIANQILMPLAQGNPFTLVAQPLANSIFIVSTPELAEKAVLALESLDVEPKANLVQQWKLSANSIFVYKTKDRSGDEILRGLNDIAEMLRQTGLAENDLTETIQNARVVKATNSILFVGSKETMVQIKEFLGSVDIPVNPNTVQSFFLYNPQHNRTCDIAKAVKEVAENLKGTQGTDPNLIQLLLSVKTNITTNTLMFSGEELFFPQVKELLLSLDTPASPAVSCETKNNFFLYKPQQVSFTELQKSLNNFAKNLNKSNANDGDLVQTIGDMKYVTESNSILFSGSDASLKRLQEILPLFDSNTSRLPVSNQFFIYKPQSISSDQFEQAIKDFSSDLKSKKWDDPAFLNTLDSAKYIKKTDSFLFTGDAVSLKKLESMIATIDIPAAQTSFFLFTPQYASPKKTTDYLTQLANGLDKKTKGPLIDTIRSMKWIEASNSFLFHGNAATLDQLKEILAAFDIPQSQTVKTSYYVYKLRNASVADLEENLDTLLDNFKSTGMKDSPVASVIENIRYVKETNSLLLTGDPAAIEEVKTIIADHDVVKTPNLSSDFFLYKPQHKKASEIEKSLNEVAMNFKKAGLGDPNLIQTIQSAKYVSTTNSLIFTGSAESIQKIQSLLKDIDVATESHAPIQRVGQSTFLLYKLKNAAGPQIVQSLQTMTADLRRSNHSDPNLITTLESMKYVKETNSLFFTGPEDVLPKVQALVEKFDVTSLGEKPEPKVTAPVSENFFVYKPQSLNGKDLLNLLEEFATHLKQSGLSDPDLFNAISSTQFVEKTQSLIFAGTPKALDQIKELLKEFDIPANMPGGGKSETTIQAIDNTSFLVYKLQFHKGDEIQEALKQISKDLIKNNAPVNQSLLNAINSIQWLDVTNSLLCSGDQETLTRLKELIKNLDIPLKQVFIELLIIETSLTNALTFGLEWGGNYKFNDKFGVSSYNTIPQANAQTPFPDTFITNLSNLTPPTAPTPIGNLPPNSGFDIGVIGEVIKHNGQTFLTLGSLLSALQTDSETTIVNTPKILAQDGRTSSFFSGSNIPFTGSFVNNTQSGSTIQTSNLEYRDIGLNLTITPVLGSSDIVTLDINLDREQTATDITQSQLNFNAQTANGIVTSKTTMQTTVHVPDRNFLILSGFVNNSTTKQKSGIPCLGALPMVGAAFSQSNDTSSGSNIVIFLRPYILNSIDDMRRITSEQEDFFRDQAGTPFLEHYFDESLELIKTIDDD